jgi:hypothetical protein
MEFKRGAPLTSRLFLATVTRGVAQQEATVLTQTAAAGVFGQEHPIEGRTFGVRHA